MRGQAVEEVVTKTEYTSAVSLYQAMPADVQETGAVLRDEEIGTAFQFGNEATVRNVLEKNWWESDAFQEEQRQVAEEVLRLDQDRRRKIEQGEEDEEVEEDVKEIKVENGDRVVARTRVS